MSEITNEVIVERLDNLIKQTTKINGSVAKNTKWRHYMAGGLVISNIIIVPIVIAIIMKLM